MISRSLLTGAALAAALAACPASAQSNPGWFTPTSPQPARPATAAPVRRAPAVRQAPVSAAPLPAPEPPMVEDAASGQAAPAADLPQPPIPPLPPLPSSFYAETQSGDPVQLTATGKGARLPGGIEADTTYYVIKAGEDAVELAATAADANAGRAITLSDAGAGTLTMSHAPGKSGQSTPSDSVTVTLPNTLHLAAKGATPPAAIIGVLGVPDVMRASSAAQAVERVIGARRDKLKVEVDRAQATWREKQQQLQADAPRLNPAQGRERERQLRDLVENDRRVLQDRNRIIQEAAQVAIGQIERTLVSIIRQVAEHRGMNLVLHRSQVALNVQEFDITDEVVAQLNRALPTVQIPPEDVDPAKLPKDWGSTPQATAKK